MFYQLLNILFAIKKFPLIFNEVQISKNYEKLYSNSLSIPLLLLDWVPFLSPDASSKGTIEMGVVRVFGFQMITWEQIVRLKLGLVCKCIS